MTSRQEHSRTLIFSTPSSIFCFDWNSSKTARSLSRSPKTSTHGSGLYLNQHGSTEQLYTGGLTPRVLRGRTVSRPPAFDLPRHCIEPLLLPVTPLYLQQSLQHHLGDGGFEWWVSSSCARKLRVTLNCAMTDGWKEDCLSNQVKHETLWSPNTSKAPVLCYTCYTLLVPPGD